MGISLLFIALVGYEVYSAFFDKNRLPTEEYFTEETSPDGKYTVKAYAMEVLERLMLFVVN
ncbi:DUF5412 family protein [Psychrobacillus sp. NPDC096426]|uniref:DUF5412 family protein n=1 Tax=Psychrobacillus sp. NPDC096426 TaxID=3364491 RepID=UPI0037FCEBE9